MNLLSEKLHVLRRAGTGATGQLIRYISIGLVLNAGLYAAYLVLTHTTLTPRPAMTLVYVSGVLVGFVLNRKFTFDHQGNGRGALLRYFASYGIGYAVNWTALWLLVDYAGIAHELVQLAMLPTLAILLFTLQRYWVFPARSRVLVPSPARSAPP